MILPPPVLMSVVVYVKVIVFLTIVAVIAHVTGTDGVDVAAVDVPDVGL